MFFGDNVGHTIRRLTHRDKYNILYRPHGSCFDHYLRHLVAEATDRFFISNQVIVDNAVNLIDGTNLEEVLATRLCAPYNFQIASNVNKNLDATLTNHIPLIYIVHTKEDLVDLENNILGRYPYIILIANKALYDIAAKLDLDKSRLFYHPFSVQDDLQQKISKDQEPVVDVSIFLGGQDPQQVQSISKKLESTGLKTQIVPNTFSSKALCKVFGSSKVVVELNPVNIYNIIYAINCGTYGLIYNKDHSGNQEYIYRNFDEMIEKIKLFISKKPELPQIGFSPDGSTDIKSILSNINNRGLNI